MVSGTQSDSSSVTLVTGFSPITGTCCSPMRTPTYTEAVEEQKKKPKNNPVPPWIRKKDNGR